MRTALRWTGNLLILSSLLGLAALGYTLLAPEPTPRDGPELLSDLAAPMAPVLAVEWATASERVYVPSQKQTVAVSPTDRPITHVSIGRTGLSADVVAARLVDRQGGATWEVPAFTVGHAEATAGAGEPGNAVLLGHVSSLRAGNVFEHLDQVQLGDAVDIAADAERFVYRVVAIERVARTDQTVLEASATPSVSLITCAGVWLPTIWDFTERLVVRAELVDAP